MFKSKRTAIEIVGGVLCLAVGLAGGRMYFTKQVPKEPYVAMNSTNVTETKTPIETEKIAVVNLDKGVPKKDETINYANKIITYPSDNYQTTSLNEAKSGIESGEFGAYIIIPATFSESVDSINNTPMTAVFDYAISEAISGESKASIVSEICNFEQQVSTSVSYMYIDAILGEVHNLQDDSSTILRNDNLDMEDINAISAEDLFQTVEFSEIKINKDTIENVDLTKDKQNIQNAFSAIKENYNTSITKGQSDFKILASSKDKVNQTFTELCKAFKLIDPMKNEKGEFITKAGLNSVGDKVDELNTNVKNQRSKLNDDIKKEIDQYAQKVQLQLNGDISDINTKIQTQVVSDLQNDVDTQITTTNAFNRQALDTAIQQHDAALGEYKKNLQQYVNSKVFTEDIKKGVKTLFENKLDTYDGTVHNKILTLQQTINSLKRQSSVTEEEWDALLDGINELDNVKQNYQASMSAEEYNNLFNGVDWKKVIDLSNAKDAENKLIVSPSFTFQIPQTDVTLSAAKITYQVPTITLPKAEDISDKSLKAIEDRYKISKSDIQDTVQSSLIDPLQNRWSAIQQEYEKKLTEFSTIQTSYQNGMDSYNPFSYLDTSKLSTNLLDIDSALSDIQQNMNTTNSSYIEYITKVESTANDNVHTYQNDLQNANNETKRRIENLVKVLKSSRSERNKTNVSLLKGFSEKLKFTRVGDLPYREAYQFIINPVQSNNLNK